MPEIAPPYEILEIPAGEKRVLHVVRYEEGTMVIHPTYPGAPDEKRVEGIRIHVKPEDKGYLPYYWDITPAHLVQGLKPILPTLQGTDRTLTIQAFLTRPGDPASKRFRLEY